MKKLFTVVLTLSLLLSTVGMTAFASEWNGWAEEKSAVTAMENLLTDSNSKLAQYFTALGGSNDQKFLDSAARDDTDTVAYSFTGTHEEPVLDAEGNPTTDEAGTPITALVPDTTPTDVMVSEVAAEVDAATGFTDGVWRIWSKGNRTNVFFGLLTADSFDTALYSGVANILLHESSADTWKTGKAFVDLDGVLVVRGSGTDDMVYGESGDHPFSEAASPADFALYTAETGGVKYLTLDEAVAAAADGGTVTLLTNCTTAGLSLTKGLVIAGRTGSETVTFTDSGIALWGKALTFRDCAVVMNGIGATPYGEWNWMSICAGQGASLALENASLTMEGDPNHTGTNLDAHAIYLCSNNQVSLTDSTLTIRNYTQDALEWNAGDGGYHFQMNRSAFLSDHNRSGFTGTFAAVMTDSQVEVVNSLGNGSNGSHFQITNSTVNFNANGGHGLSAGNLFLVNSTLNAKDNNLNGIVGRNITIDSASHVLVEGNTKNEGGYHTLGAFRVMGSTGKCVIDAGADVQILNNYMSGIQIDNAKGSMVMNAGVVTGNGRSDSNTLGGGVRTLGSFTMAAGVQIYNNHAAVMGDDIYADASGKVTLVPTAAMGSPLVLDDCSHTITGWFRDGYRQNGDMVEESRWNIGTCEADRPVYAVEFTVPVEAIGGVLALKAAHAALPVSDDGGSSDDPSTPVVTPTDPTTEIADEDTPLAPVPVEEIPEKTVPLAEVPQTGDNHLLLISAVCAAASLTGLAWIALSSKKRETI